MEAWGRRLAFALRYFTRFPLPVKVKIVKGDIAKSTMLFPIVGVFEGLFVALCGFVGSQFGFPVLMAVFLLAARLIISRGQIRNMAHATDGLGSSRDRVHMIQIMFDDQFGALGVVSMIFVCLFKFAFYYEMMGNMSFASAVPIIICSCFAGKLSLVAGIATSSSVFENDKLIDQTKIFELIVCAIITYVLTYLMFGWLTAGLVLLVQISVGLILSGMVVMKLGGLTKQTLGILHEVGEIMLLFILMVW